MPSEILFCCEPVGTNMTLIGSLPGMNQLVVFEAGRSVGGVVAKRAPVTTHSSMTSTLARPEKSPKIETTIVEHFSCFACK